MKSTFLFAAVLLFLVAFNSCKTEIKEVPVPKAEISQFLGQWTIDIEGGGVGWLEVRQEDNYIDADVLWEGGSVLPVSSVFLAKDEYLVVQRTNNVVRKADENRNPLK